MFSSIDLAIKELKNKKPVIILDSEDRENEGDLVYPADIVDHNMINFMITHCRGVVCLCITVKQAQKLNLELIPKKNYHSVMNVANFALPIEAAEGITTGISTLDRAHTIRVAINPNASPNDIAIPGHLFTIIGEPQGLLKRQGHTEASMSITKLAGFEPASVICEIISDDGTMAKTNDLLAFGQHYNIPVITIDGIIEFMKKHNLNFLL